MEVDGSPVQARNKCLFRTRPSPRTNKNNQSHVINTTLTHHSNNQKSMGMVADLDSLSLSLSHRHVIDTRGKTSSVDKVSFSYLPCRSTFESCRTYTLFYCRLRPQSLTCVTKEQYQFHWCKKMTGTLYLAPTIFKLCITCVLLYASMAQLSAILYRYLYGLGQKHSLVFLHQHLCNIAEQIFGKPLLS